MPSGWEVVSRVKVSFVFLALEWLESHPTPLRPLHLLARCSSSVGTRQTSKVFDNLGSRRCFKHHAILEG
jgi:hypothetical protein